MMKTRLILAIISTVLEETALVVIVLWGLPKIGINIPMPGLIALMLLWGCFSIFVYRMGSRALRKEPVVGLPTMIGSRGKVVSPLNPEGTIKIKAELWETKSVDGSIGIGEEVTVIGQDGLKLIVRKFMPDTEALNDRH